MVYCYMQTNPHVSDRCNRVCCLGYEQSEHVRERRLSVSLDAPREGLHMPIHANQSGAHLGVGDGDGGPGRGGDLRQSGDQCRLLGVAPVGAHLGDHREQLLHKESCLASRRYKHPISLSLAEQRCNLVVLKAHMTDASYLSPSQMTCRTNIVCATKA